MFTKSIAFTISLLAFVCSQHSVLANKYHNAVRMNIARMALSPRASSMQQQKDCQAYYNPILQQITSDYWAESIECIDVADQQRKEVQDQQAAVRQQVENMSDQVCSDLTTCKGNEDSLEFFGCSKNAGTIDNPVLISIVGSSSQAETNIQAAYKKIDSDETICQSKCFEKYQTNWNAKSNEMSQCSLGLATIPPPTTTTSGTTTTTTTTPAATDPTTDVPTEAPTNAPTEDPTAAPQTDSFRL